MQEFNLTSYKKIALIAISIIIAWVCYSNHFHNPFTFDDDHTITTNQNIQSLKNIPHFFVDATTTSSLPMNQAYRPGLTTLNAIDFWIGGEATPNSFYFHISIFISFILLGLLLIKFTTIIFKFTFDVTTSFVFSVFLGLWFWLHAANTQTINYIIARADSFSTLTVIAAFCMYVCWPSKNKFYVYMLPIIIGFMVKEPVVMFVPLLFVYKLLFEKNKSLSQIFSKEGLPTTLQVLKELALPFCIIIVLYIFSRQMTPKHWFSGNSDALGYLMSQPYVILHYFNNFILPANLVIDTDWEFVKSYTDDRVIIGLMFLALMIYVIFKTSVNHKPIAFGLAWFLLALLPTSSVFPLAEVLNDHRPFFAYIGLFIAATYLVILLYKKIQLHHSKIVTGVYYSIITLFILSNGYYTYLQNCKWNTSQSIWEEATLKSPKNARVWMNYGNALMSKAIYDEAEIAYNKAATLWPNYGYIYINLGILKGATSNADKADEYFKKGIALDANVPDSYFYYAKFLKGVNRIGDCISNVDKGLALSPKHVELTKMKADLNLQLQNPEEFKLQKLNAALEIVKQNPNSDNYINLSLEYYNLMEYENCIKACEEALKLNPKNAIAYNNICSSYNELKLWDKAIEAGNKGLAFDSQNALLKGNLNVAITQKNKK